jgi:VWFA-related protein
LPRDVHREVTARAMKYFVSAFRARMLAAFAAAAMLILAGPAQPRNFLQHKPNQSDLANVNQESQNPIQVLTSLVQVDAIVTDKNGKHIAGLEPENFLLFEDNHVQKIIAADYFDVSNAQDSGDSGPIFVSLLSSNDSQTLRAMGHNHRLIVLFFDLTSFRSSASDGAPDFNNVLRTVGAAKQFVKEQMTSADLVSVVSFGTDLLVLSDFTNDRGTVDHALDSLLPGTGALDPSLPRNMNNTLMPGTFVHGATGLEAAQALSEMLAQIPGRKSVIHFTDGLGSSGGSGLDRTTAAANKSNASFYEVVAAGLCVSPPAGDASVGFREGGPGVAHSGPVGSCASVGVLYTLAADTGGELFRDSNDFAPYFKQVQEESTGYYLLAYDPSNKKRDGSYRSIAVKLIGVPGGHLTYRPGYYAPRDAK